MKRLFAAVAVAASLALQACSGNGLTPATPNAPYGSSLQEQPSGVLDFNTQKTAPTLPGFADAVAYGEYTTRTVKGQTSVVSGPAGDTPLECGTAKGDGTTTVPTISSPYATSSGSSVNTFASSGTSSQGNLTTTSTTMGISILKGMITAKSVKAIANSTATKTTATSNATGTIIDGLVIAGKSYGNPKPNTSVPLNGYGYVVINGVQLENNKKSTSGSLQTSALVQALRVVIDNANPMKIPVGTTIIIGDAYSSFTIPPAPYEGSPTAYSLFANGINGNMSDTTGPWDVSGVSCNSSSDDNTETAEKTPLGEITKLANDTKVTADKTTTSVTATSNTGSASLLSGLIVASNVATSATVGRSSTKFTNAGTMTFGSLKINGKTIASSVKPNTKIKIAGLGTIMINQQYIEQTSGGISEEVDAVDVYVTAKNNKYKLAVGAEVVLGHARAQISPF
jgi:hypothetical protein